MTPSIVVALWSEAKPLIDHFRMRPSAPAAPFRVYRCDDASLVVSGVGKVAAAAAVSYLFAVEGEGRERPWLNVGIAGHRSLAIGSGLLADRVEDAASGRVWYPCPVFDPPAPLGPIITRDRVEKDYTVDAAYDMEAAGFVATASRFSPAELIHVYKVVSDGPGSVLEELTAGRVSELVTGHLEAVERLMIATRELASELAGARPVVELEPWLARWRFTVSQRRRLERLLGRLRVLDDSPLEPGHLELRPGDAKRALAALEDLLVARTPGARVPTEGRRP